MFSRLVIGYLSPFLITISCSLVRTVQALVDDADSVLLGLRIYTKQDAPVKISGQLRRGQLMRWKKNSTVTASA